MRSLLMGAVFGWMVPPTVTRLAGTAVGAINFCLALLAGPETKGTRFIPDLVADGRRSAARARQVVSLPC